VPSEALATLADWHVPLLATTNPGSEGFDAWGGDHGPPNDGGTSIETLPLALTELKVKFKAVAKPAVTEPGATDTDAGVGPIPCPSSSRC